MVERVNIDQSGIDGELLTTAVLCKEDKEQLNRIEMLLGRVLNLPIPDSTE